MSLLPDGSIVAQDGKCMILLNFVVVVSGRMEAEVGYNPPEEFAEESVNSLVDINLNDSTELWLIQLPENHVIFFPFNIRCPKFFRISFWLKIFHLSFEYLQRSLQFIAVFCVSLFVVDFLLCPF